MATFQPFDMERMMSKWENVVAYNLSESGVYPATIREFVDDPAVIEELLSTELNYPQANGIIELRERIAALYPGAAPDNVLVTVGCAEANFIALQTLLTPGDEMVMMLPNYMQIWGIAHNYGMRLHTFHLREERGWAPDLDELNDAVSEKTKLIAVCNPNNPTGYILTEEEMDVIVAAAARVGAWLLADEVYSGAERLTDTQTPSFWGRYDKVLAMGSLSKAYGLPGLRIGWVVGPVNTVDDIWARHEYTTISATMLSNKLASIALSPQVRPRLVQRARDYIRRGFPILEAWLESHQGVFTLIPPQAAAIAFPRYHLDVNSTRLVERLIHEKSVFIVPGDHFGLDHHLRISFGLPPHYLRAGLDRIHELMVELQ
ncbi:MAG: aminotransferase class I/II-fold pyridoxal phosphate-dependent enzyme [Anaerolineae bacterium]|jgi:aspartate/methionine/tyrosine aminotransferase|nr:aminotransferase class I/II-fold pyridoxal phosphate-dependent enzyme [Anaerolineae bacterium]MDH7473705.1 aminotransferase class I/II-fold pyridoxal phosphate-dependent enzyme [Anaerolineae bacterium]